MPVSTKPSFWWRHAVIYQIYPRSFADANGDGIGDLPGIATHLPYLVKLGVDAIWLSPCFRSPQIDAGYDVSDYRDIDPIFGTRADFEHLISEAHGAGLRVIADLVPNHTSDQHPWFQQALLSPPAAPSARAIFSGTAKANMANYRLIIGKACSVALPGQRNPNGPDRPPGNGISTFSIVVSRI